MQTPQKHILDAGVELWPSNLQLEGFLALGHASSILREGSNSISLSLGVRESVEELTLEGGR